MLTELPVKDPVRRYTGSSLMLIVGFDPLTGTLTPQSFTMDVLEAGTVVTVLRKLTDTEAFPAGVCLVQVRLPSGEERWLYASLQQFQRVSD